MQMHVIKVGGTMNIFGGIWKCQIWISLINHHNLSTQMDWQQIYF
jgi:hypothetical protein